MQRGSSIAAVLAFGAALGGYAVLHLEPISARHVPITTKIVFNREIAQIFQKKCFQCHTDGNVSMALTTYREARPWAVAIKEEILERKMPPWSAASGYGHFSNDMSLTAREISLILSWTDGGAPSGVLLADEDKQPVFVPSPDAWQQGEPDEIIKVAEEVRRERQAAVGQVSMRSIKGFGFSPKEFFEQIPNAFRSATIGLGIGILPGIGAGTSNIVAYIAAKKRA